MAPPALVQSKAATGTNSDSNQIVTLDAPPAAGSLVVAVFTIRADAAITLYDPGAIWTFLPTTQAVTNGGYQTVAWSWALPQTLTVNDAANYKRLVLAEFSGVDPLQAPLVEQITARTGVAISPDLLPADDGDFAIAAYIVSKQTGVHPFDTNDAAWAEVDQGQVGGNFAPRGALYWRVVSGDEVDGAATVAPLSSGTIYHGATVVTWRSTDNIPSPGGPGEPADPPTTLPEKQDDPGAAILEVYVIEAGAPIWDIALWDDSWAWGEGGWRSITPQGVTADIRWGSDQSELGILAPAAAAVWNVTTYDPERVLDPANEDGPAYPQIVPFLPIRLRHRSTVIRTGYVESVTYDYATDRGQLRATDNIARMANADVPPDQIPFLSTQLHARARDAILAAGLDVYVPFGNAPWGAVELAPLEEGSYTVWQIIAQSAQEALYMPYLDKDEQLRFRPYAHPRDTGLRVAAPELVGLTVAVDHNGLYSSVAVTDYSDADAEIVHAITPTPPYGKRLYSRSPARTILGADWADAVLADRGAPSQRLVPGRIRPLTATRVEDFAHMQIMDTVQISHAYTAPNVEAQGRILGERVRVESLASGLTDWQWWIDTAAAGVGPLIADYLGDLPPREWLTDDETGEYLYPDGVIVTEVL